MRHVRAGPAGRVKRYFPAIPHLSFFSFGLKTEPSFLSYQRGHVFELILFFGCFEIKTSDVLTKKYEKAKTKKMNPKACVRKSGEPRVII